MIGINTIGDVALTLLGGAVGAIVLELWLKPCRDRKRAARILLHEISLNLRNLQLHLPNVAYSSHTTSAPADLVISREGLGIVGPLMSELPSRTVGFVLEIYGRFAHIEGIIASRDKLTARQAGPINDPNTMRLQPSVVEATRALEVSMKVAIERAELTMEALGKNAKDRFWNSRRRQAP